MFSLYKLFSTVEEQEELARKYRGGNFGFGHAKLALLEKSQAYFAPKQERFNDLMADLDQLEDVLQAGAAKARAVARPVLQRVRDAVGLPALLG